MNVLRFESNGWLWGLWGRRGASVARAEAVVAEDHHGITASQHEALPTEGEANGATPVGRESIGTASVSGRFRPRARFDEGLDETRGAVVAMFQRAGEMLRDAVDALTHQEEARVTSVLERDDLMNQQARATEGQVFLLLTLQQPVMASDLRCVTMLMGTTSDVERIGDQCVNIANVGRRMANEGVPFYPDVDLEPLTALAVRMVETTTRALEDRDLTAAQAVITTDDALDRLYADAQQQLRARMGHATEVADPAEAVRASYLLFVTHYLERIGDHCVRAANRVLEAASHRAQ